MQLNWEGGRIENREFQGTVVKWINSMLTTTRAERLTGTDSITIETQRGCPQGSVLSPLL